MGLLPGYTDREIVVRAPAICMPGPITPGLPRAEGELLGCRIENERGLVFVTTSGDVAFGFGAEEILSVRKTAISLPGLITVGIEVEDRYGIPTMITVSGPTRKLRKTFAWVGQSI